MQGKRRYTGQEACAALLLPGARLVFLFSCRREIFYISGVQSSIVLVGDTMQHSYLLEGSLLTIHYLACSTMVISAKFVTNLRDALHCARARPL